MKSLRTLRIGVIGAGNMGQALIRGLRASGVSPARLMAVEANPAARRHLRARYRLTASSLSTMVQCADVIIVAVKPQDIAPVLAEVRHARNILLISIAAGVPCSTIERLTGRLPVVRVMPNLPATVGAGISAIVGGRHATSAHRAIAKAIFSCVGDVVELPERLFDMVTAVSGSGPAYYFVVCKALCDAAIRAGMPSSVARHLAVQTALGSARLAISSDDTLEALIAKVASKKGTTEAALTVLRRRNFAGILEAAVAAAARRSRQLRRG